MLDENEKWKERYDRAQDAFQKIHVHSMHLEQQHDDAMQHAKTAIKNFKRLEDLEKTLKIVEARLEKMEKRAEADKATFKDIERRLDDQRRHLGADRFRQPQAMGDGLFGQRRAVGCDQDIPVHAPLPV